MNEILTNHQPEPLTAEQERAVARMPTDAREHYRKEGMVSDEELAEYSTVLDSAT